MEDIISIYSKSAFECPHCHAYAQMEWSHLSARSSTGHLYSTQFAQASCVKCQMPSLWRRSPTDPSPDSEAYKTVWPIQIEGVPEAHPDLPEACRQDYEEARTIFPHSPRASAALLRLVIERLCQHFGSSTKNINQNIATMVAKGLQTRVQRALDYVRVIGNEAVHPGQVSEDSKDNALVMFKLIHIITDRLITEEKDIDQVYDMLPPELLQHIDERNTRAKANSK